MYADPETIGTARQLSVRRAGTACAAGAAVLAVGGLATQVVAASTDVSDQAWSYPWSSGTSMAISVLWAAAQALLVVGVLAVRRSGAAGTTRAASLGLTLAAVGTALIVVGHLASLPVADQAVDDTGPLLVGGVFGLASVLSAVGLLMAGSAAVRARRWAGWRRFAVLATGLAMVVLIGLQLTPALPTAVALYALGFLGVGVALRRPPVPARADAPFAGVAGR